MGRLEDPRRPKGGPTRLDAVWPGLAGYFSVDSIRFYEFVDFSPQAETGRIFAREPR